MIDPRQSLTSLTGDTLRRILKRGVRWGAYLGMPKFTVGSIVVARRGREVLIVRKRGNPVQWGFPAGYLFYGETPPVTATRELVEETGIRADVTAADFVSAYRQPWMAHFDHLFLVAADGNPTIGDSVEIAEARWWPVENLPPLAREADLALRSVPDLLTCVIPYSKRAASPAP